MDSRQWKIRIRKQWKVHWTVAVSCRLMIQLTFLDYECRSPGSKVFLEILIINKSKNRWRSTPKSSITVFSNFNWQLRIVKSPKFQFFRLSPQSEAWGRRHMVPKVISLVDREISLTSTAGRGLQCYTGPSEYWYRSAVNTDRCWDSSEGFPGRQKQREGDSRWTLIGYKATDDFNEDNPTSWHQVPVSNVRVDFFYC